MSASHRIVWLCTPLLCLLVWVVLWDRTGVSPYLRTSRYEEDEEEVPVEQNRTVYGPPTLEEVFNEENARCLEEEDYGCNDEAIERFVDPIDVLLANPEDTHGLVSLALLQFRLADGRLDDALQYASMAARDHDVCAYAVQRYEMVIYYGAWTRNKALMGDLKNTAIHCEKTSPLLPRRKIERDEWHLPQAIGRNRFIVEGGALHGEHYQALREVLSAVDQKKRVENLGYNVRSRANVPVFLWTAAELTRRSRDPRAVLAALDAVDTYGVDRKIAGRLLLGFLTRPGVKAQSQVQERHTFVQMLAFARQRIDLPEWRDLDFSRWPNEARDPPQGEMTPPDRSGGRWVKTNGGQRPRGVNAKAQMIW